MKQALITLLILTMPAYADEEKPVATQATEVITPYAEALSKSASRTVTEFMAGGKGPMAEGVRVNIKVQDQHQRKTNRVINKGMNECKNKPDLYSPTI